MRRERGFLDGLRCYRNRSCAAGGDNGELVAVKRKELTVEEYLQAIELCRCAVDAHDDMIDGGGTIAGHFLGKLRILLTEESSDET